MDTKTTTRYRRFAVEVLKDGRWVPTPYQQLTETKARPWLSFFQRQGRQVRLVRVQVEAERVVH